MQSEEGYAKSVEAIGSGEGEGVVGERREGEGGEGVGEGQEERGVKIRREMVARAVVRGCTFSKNVLSI
jgi:hypothetical protein